MTDPLKVRYEDDHAIAVSKPSGLLVHRTELAPDRDVLLQRLRRQIRCHLYPVHRLDRGASGLVWFAKSAADARWLQVALGDDATARKEYTALVRGRVTESMCCDRPLRDDRGRPRPSRTDVEPLEVLGRCSLVRIRLRSGRRHQIRRHMNHAGHHVLGDTTHGKGRINREFRERYGLWRLFLHAACVELVHGIDGRRLRVLDPLPAELEAVLAQLRAEPAG